MKDYTVFISEFHSALTFLSPELTPEQCIGTVYHMPETSFSSLNCILSSGCIHASAPYNYAVKNLNCFMLLYTEKGHGSCKIDRQIFPLSSSGSNLLLLDCRSHLFQLTAASPVWDFHIFYFTGDMLTDLFQALQHPLYGVYFTHIHSCTPTFSFLEQLILHSSSCSMRSALYISGLLYQLVTSCAAEQFPEESYRSVPDYLVKVRTLLDLHYEELYTLDSLSGLTQVNKYRLCREFHTYFGCSPIQYLNRVRMCEAKKLLESTNYKVYEVGCLVGIDNTNHFISLFKKHTGFTPDQYRKHLP